MRIVMKISGEALKNGDNLSSAMLERILDNVLSLEPSDNELILVIGGGNFWRGRNGLDISNSISDQIGMLGSMMNAMAICDYLNKNSIVSSIYCAYGIDGVVPKYDYYSILEDLSNKKIVVLGGGLGVPNFSTDMVTVEKAVEYSCDMIIMGKNIDGIYDKDPSLNGAKKIDFMTHKELLDNQIKEGIDKQGVMDFEAICTLCKYKIPLYVYDLKEKNGLKDFINKKYSGTIVKTD